MHPSNHRRMAGKSPKVAPEGEGAASTGSRPRSMRHCRAAERPSRRQESVSLLSWGMTRVMMGMGGRYLLTKLAVLPAGARAL